MDDNWKDVNSEKPIRCQLLNLKFGDGTEGLGFLSMWSDNFRRLTEDSNVIELSGVTHWRYAILNSEKIN